MTRLLIAAIAVALAAAGLFLWREGTPGRNAPPALTITMNDDGYYPASAAVRTGDVVRFMNSGARDHWPASNIHPTHEIYPEFDPARPIAPGESWSFRFDQAGIWRWHDHLYPSIVGTITVE